MVSRGLGRRNEDLVKKNGICMFCFFFAICKMWDFAFRMAAAIRLEETGFRMIWEITNKNGTE
jgi:hypothetical protein